MKNALPEPAGSWVDFATVRPTIDCKIDSLSGNSTLGGHIHVPIKERTLIAGREYRLRTRVNNDRTIEASVRLLPKKT